MAARRAARLASTRARKAEKAAVRDTDEETLATDGASWMDALSKGTGSCVSRRTAEVRDDLSDELRQVEGERLHDEWMARLKAKHFINIY